jgi:uncharacterized membrane protein YbhN (UPF0104 family)
LNWKKTVNFIVISIIIYLSCKYLLQLSDEISLKKIITSLNFLNVKFIFLSFFLTILNYFIVIFYDISVSKQLKLSISFKHLSLISLITFIINNNLGFGAFLGGAMRLRFFSRLNINLKDIAKYLIIFSWVYWVGLIFLASITFLFIIPDTNILMPFVEAKINARLIGLLTISSLAVFILISVLKDIFKLNWSLLFPFASTKRLITITLISTLDWVLLSLIFYFLLPHGKLVYFDFLPNFLIAQIGSVTSHLPAGIGVFDSIMIYYFKDIFGLNTLLSSLLIFRVIYFIIPMIFALSMFFLYEIHWNNKLKLRKEKL